MDSGSASADDDDDDDVPSRKLSLLAFLISILTCSTSVPRSSSSSSRSRRMKLVPAKAEELKDRDPVVQQLQVQLPALSQQSFLLSEDLRAHLHGALPVLSRGCHWVLVYSTRRDGISLLTLYRKTQEMPGPFLLATSDTRGAVFGALISDPLKPAPARKYQGNSETFVFTTVSGSSKVFRPTGVNRYFVLCTNECLAWGGGGSFALHIDSDLLSGSSGESETFGNSCLSSTREFSLKELELWGFQHASKMR